MPVSSPELSYDRWNEPCWQVRVRGSRDLPVYLWGSAGIKENLRFSTPLVLHVHNDVFGEEITIGTRVANGVMTTLGTLQAGEAVSIPVQAISGVFATCELESTVWCLIKDVD